MQHLLVEMLHYLILFSFAALFFLYVVKVQDMYNFTSFSYMYNLIVTDSFKQSPVSSKTWMAIGCCESQAQPQLSLNTPSDDDTDRCSTASSAGSYACGEDVRPAHIGQTSQKQEPNCNLGLPRFAYVSENGIIIWQLTEGTTAC